MQLTWIERKLSFVYCKSNKPTLVPTHAELLAACCVTRQAADIALREAKEEQRLNLMTAKKAPSVTTELLALRGTGGLAKSRALSQDLHGKCRVGMPVQVNKHLFCDLLLLLQDLAVV